MVGVGPELGQPAVLDRRDHPAERLADPAVGDLLLGGHGVSRRGRFSHKASRDLNRVADRDRRRLDHGAVDAHLATRARRRVRFRTSRSTSIVSGSIVVITQRSHGSSTASTSSPIRTRRPIQLELDRPGGALEVDVRAKAPAVVAELGHRPVAQQQDLRGSRTRGRWPTCSACAPSPATARIAAAASGASQGWPSTSASPSSAEPRLDADHPLLAPPGDEPPLIEDPQAAVAGDAFGGDLERLDPSPRAGP